MIAEMTFNKHQTRVTLTFYLLIAHGHSYVRRHRATAVIAVKLRCTNTQ